MHGNLIVLEKASSCMRNHTLVWFTRILVRTLSKSMRENALYSFGFASDQVVHYCFQTVI